MPTTSEMDSSGVQQVQQQESKSNEKSNNNSEAMSVEDTEASDEVKNFCNEEEEAEDDLRDQTEAKASLSSLSDDKSTLITESEQSKEPPRGHHDLAFASKMKILTSISALG